jgi:hypothetical protein
MMAKQMECTVRASDYFFRTIGSMATLTELKVYFGHVEQPAHFGRLIQSFQFLKKLRVVTLFEFELNYPELAAGLTGHSCLCEVDLNLPTSSYSIILSILRTIVHLNKVALTLHDPDGAFDQVDKDAVTAFFLTDLPIAVRLSCFCMKTEELGRWWCDIIATTQMRDVDLYRCRCWNASSLATALTSRTHFQSVSVHEPTFESGTFCDFCRTLALRLPLMKNLEEFSLGYTLEQEPGLSARNCAQATAEMIQSISHCSRLKSFALELRTYTVQLDRALAACIMANTLLGKITMTCTNTRYLEEHEGTNLPLSFPAVLHAVKSTCSVQRVEFRSKGTVHKQADDPWDADSIKALDMVLRLNRSGRSYIKSKPTNMQAACTVFAAVSDDLDCLNFHMRENPSICYQALHVYPTQVKAPSPLTGSM